MPNNTIKDAEYKKFVNNNTQSPAVRVVNTDSGRSAFGDAISVSPDAILQLSGQYGTPSNSETFTGASGTVANADNMFILNTGTSVGGYAVLRTKKAAIYREGQGLSCRITTIFNTVNAAANSLQACGFFNVQDTLGFGYRGADFAIINDSYGSQETRVLTITVAGNGNLTLTLNSVAYVIPITTGTIAHNGYEIVAWMAANQSIWNAQQIGDTVIFQSANVGAAAGTYSISGAGLSGTFSTDTTGQAQEQVTILQSEWNGEDVSGFFVPSEGNVYQIQVSYLGFGPFKFYIQNKTTGEFVLVHTVINVGRTKPSLSNRALKIGWISASLGSTSNITVKGSSCGAFVDGNSKLLRETLSHSNTNSAVGSATFVSVLSLSVKESFKGKAMLARLSVTGLRISSDSTKETQYKITKNANLGETAFVDHGIDDISLYDNLSRALVGGIDIDEGSIGASGATFVDLSGNNIDVLLNDTLTVYAKVVSGSASNVTAALVWKEDL